MAEARCYCNGFPYPDLSRLAEMTGYLKEYADETGDDSPLEMWREIRRSINRPVTDHVEQVQREMGSDG